ncbi:MAG TPA: histidine kinase, partial [Terriglobales bacterium]|nr:histidine kinase [Terriglobales bacterium]
IALAAILLCSAGASSPLFLFLLFVLLAAGYRWGLWKALATSALAILLLVSEAAARIYALKPLGLATQAMHEVHRLLVPSGYVLAMGLLIGLLAEEQKRLRAESSTIAHLLAKMRPNQGFRQSLQAVVNELSHIFAADSVLLVCEDLRWKKLYIWEASFGDVESHQPKLHLSEADSSEQSAYNFPFGGEFMYAVRRQARSGSRLVSLRALAADGTAVSGSGCVFPDHPLWRDVNAVIAGSFTLKKDWSGRLFLINPKLGRTRLATLRYLQTLIHQLSPALSAAYMLRRIRSEAAAVERKRIAQDLHDGPIQSLIALQMQLHLLRSRHVFDSNGLAAELANIQKKLREEITNLREVALRLTPPDLSPRQFVEFLGDLVQRFRHETGIYANFVTALEEVTLPVHVLRELARSVQEALINARKHSGARHILVCLDYKDGFYRIAVDDDGCGFDFTGRFSQKQLEAERKGPLLIQERMRDIGGELTIESVRGGGARLEISVPSVTLQAANA